MDSERSHWTFALLFAVALGLTGFVVWPFRGPLLLAVVLASVLQSTHLALTALLRGRETVSASLVTFAVFVTIVGPLAAIVAFVAGQVGSGVAFVRSQLGGETVSDLEHGTLSPHGRELVDRTLATLHLSRSQLEEFARHAASTAEAATHTVIGASSRAAFFLVVMLVAFFFFLIEGERLSRWLWRLSPLAETQTRELFDEFQNVSRASLLGAGAAALFQAVLASVGFLLSGLPHPLFFGLLTLFASFIPVVGTVLVWLPSGAYLWFTGHHGSAILLGVWCAVFVVGAEHVGKPFLLRLIMRGGSGEMHTGLVFLALLGGIEMFGLIGLVLGPLIVAFLLAMLRMYERDYRQTT